MRLPGITILFFVLQIQPRYVLGFPDGPFPSLTGGFSEQTCHECHNTYKIDEGRTKGGLFHIVGIPRRYREGETYPISVVIGQPAQERWGFELAVRYMASGHQAGRVVPIDDQTQVRESGNVQYLMHTENGTRRGAASGPLEFKFNWVAPETSGALVIFNASGNAADNDGKTSGDFIYTASGFSSGKNDEPAVAGASPPSRQEKRRRPAEDSRVSHITAPADFDRGDFKLLIQHRFLGDLSDAGSLFGVDNGANINLEVGYSLTDRFSITASRARFDKIVSLAGAFELWGDSGSTTQGQLRAGSDGRSNFQEHYSPFLEVAAKFDLNRLRIHANPVVSFNTRRDPVPDFLISDSVNPNSNHTFALGLGGDFILTRHLSLVGEYIVRLDGYGGVRPELRALSGGLKIRTRRHVFHLVVTNNRGFTPSTYVIQPDGGSYSFGFNIYRRISP
jgi:hypothetical protein